MKNTYSLLPFISRSSFNLTLACSDVLAHFDCVTEALKEIRSDIKITPYHPVLLYLLEDHWQGTLYCIFTKTEPHHSI